MKGCFLFEGSSFDKIISETIFLALPSINYTLLDGNIYMYMEFNLATWNFDF